MRPLLPLLCLTTACASGRFERAWEAAPDTGASALPCSRWEGEWRSAWNGHSGGLRCLLQRVDEHHLHAWFLSTYASVLTFQHALHFHLEPGPDGSFSLSGQRDLGALIGGLYRYEGTLDATHFHATYSAENGDQGVFELTRVPDEPEPLSASGR